MEDYQEIYTLHFQDVYKYVLALSRGPSLAEEITQEAFFKALKSLDSFQGQCKLYVWLCQIAKNTYLSYLKKHKEPEAEETLTSSLEEMMLDKESAFLIHQALHYIHHRDTAEADHGLCHRDNSFELLLNSQPCTMISHPCPIFCFSK